MKRKHLKKDNSDKEHSGKKDNSEKEQNTNAQL